MDFDDAKENIQPLAAGRNASILQAALHADSQHELQQQRHQYEDSIKNYEGDDPLEPWFEYIYWIEQSFPSGGKESGLEEVLLKCLTKFEKDERYHQDRRMIKLYIKYIDTHENPQECYQQLYNQGIGTMVADLYICWAYYFDLSGNFRRADEIFRKGIECRAQPLEELQEAHQHFGFTMSQRILYNDDNSKQKYQCTLLEKRHALTSLQSHRKKVGSIRTGAAVKNYAPGRVQLNSNTSLRRGNVSVRVFEDENQDPNVIPPSEPHAPNTSTSVVKTLLDSARKQENVKEPGPWNKAHDKKKGKLFASEPRADLGFEILEDDEYLQPIKGKINYGKPFVQYDGFVARNKPQGQWNLPVTLENELRPYSYPSYDKCLLYPRPNMEYSPEELRGYYWYKRKGIENNFTKKYDVVWQPNLSAGVRRYPNFPKNNQPVAEEPITRDFDPLAVNANGDSKLAFDPKLCYPSEEEELQFEEVMYRRWKNGERKLRYGGNETIAITEEMEETICLPHEAPRRKSFFPTAISFAPPKFATEAEVEETPKTSIPRRSVIMKTPKKAERNDFPEPTVTIQNDDDEADDEAFTFKTPAAPPMKQHKLNFQIYEEDENNYEANETCSTQVFNCFIKAQSVSTPKAPAKVMKPSTVERQHTNLNFSGIENVPLLVNPHPTAALSVPEYNDVGLTLHSKQLSTIMETSEQGTGNTASTKSSMSSPEFEGEGQHSKTTLTNNVCSLETVQEAGSLTEKEEVRLMKSLRLIEDTPTVRQYNEISRLEQREDTIPTMPAVKLFEDKTETVPKILLAKAGNFSRLEEKEDTTPSIKPVRFQEDKTETITKMIYAPMKPVINEIPPDDEMLELFAKSPEKRVCSTKTVTNMFTPAANKSIFTASSFINFHDSPDAKLRCNYDSPELRSKHSSLIRVNKSTNQSFLPNFDDPMDVDGGEKKKPSESSFLPNFSATSSDVKRHHPKNNSFLVGTPSQTAVGGDSRRQQSKNGSFLHGCRQESRTGNHFLQEQTKEDSFLRCNVSAQHQAREISFLPEFAKENTRGGGTSPIQKSTQDSFLAGFPSVTVGNNKPQNDSFMSYISNAESLKAKQATEDSFMKKFSSAGVADKPKKVSETSFNAAGNSFMKLSFAEGDRNPRMALEPSSECGDYFTKSTKVAENSFMPNISVQRKKEDSFTPNLSTKAGATPAQTRTGSKSMLIFKDTEESFVFNSSATGGAQRAKALGDQSSTRGHTVLADSSLKRSPKTIEIAEPQRPEDVAPKEFSFRCASQMPYVKKDLFMNSYTDSVGIPQRSSNVSFLSLQNEAQKPSEDSFKFNLSKSPQRSSKASFQELRSPSDANKPSRLSKISQFPQRMDTSKHQKVTPQMNQSQSNATLSFLNTFSATDARKQPEQADKFAIFEDSNCEKATPVPETRQTNKFSIFEDSNSQRRTSVKQGNKNSCFDVSLRPDDFFEDNIRTEAFASDLSMIKNSTWLPNHNPRQAQIQEQSLHIKDEINISPASQRGLSIFSSVPQEKSVDLMPPPPPIMAPKVPVKPTKPTEVFSDCIEIPESDDEENINDLGKSIYYTKTPKTPKITRHDWSPESDRHTPEMNAFVHRQVDLDHTHQVIDDYFEAKDVNPFNQDLLDAFLNQIDFTNYIEKVPTCDLVGKIKPLRKDSTISISGRTFHVMKLIGEGSYGAVYCAKEQKSGKMFALKQERPANLWEYYVCLELRSRLRNTEILAGFLNIEYALIGNNAGILVSPCSRYGSLIAVCNKIKKETLKNVDEYVVMHMASQLLLIMDHLHASNIIHADVKPDNFLLMEKLVPGRKQPTIQLIDFGTSIDMDLFKKGQTFRYIHQTDSFKCVEMHEKRPWTYQLDLFGLAGVIHVLLFGKYMQIVKKPTGWTHSTNVPRYFNRSLWETVFHTLLNIDNCQTMPNLQNLRAQLEEEIAEMDKTVYQKIVEFNRALDL